MRLLLARREDQLRHWNDAADAVLWLGPEDPPPAVRTRAVKLPPDPTALEGWLAIRRLGDLPVGGRSVKQALAYEGVSLWWFVHYWLVYGHGLTGWDERYRTLCRLMAGLTARPDEIVLLTDRADDNLVARSVAARHGLRYRWVIAAWAKADQSIRLRWRAELLFRVRMVKLIVRGFLANAIRRNSVAGRGPVDLMFNTSSSTWELARGIDRVLGPLIEQAERRGLSVAGLHLDHRRNLGVDTLRGLDGRIIVWESLVTPAVAVRGLLRGRRIARDFGGPFPGEVLGIPAADLLADRLPVLFGARLADAIVAIETSREILDRIRPRCVYLTDAYDLWGRAIVVSARSAGLTSIEVQHGIIQQSHDGYLHLEGEVAADRSQRSPFSPVPDLILVHGEAAKEALVEHGQFPPDSVRVVGSPQIEAARQRRETAVDARRKLGLTATGLYVLFFGAPYHVFPADDDHLRAFLACCREMPGIVPLLRPHPAEYTGDRYRAAAQAASVIAPVLSEADPFELIVASDIVISHNSTTALDAMVLQRPVIHMNMSGSPDLFPFVDEAGAISARTQEELRASLEALSSPGARDSLVARHTPYALRYYADCPDPAAEMLAAGFPKRAPV
ncbi:MAG TPA: hypothetical protein VJR46_04505 [Candidatus Dormibacteraeota bacterium]|nr:hypothetical protein [Candidatus Dormibacteraeota bacterium]